MTLPGICRFLPLNREERFWTATVFPSITAGAEMERVGRLVSLIRKNSGLDASQKEVEYPDACVLTEYSRYKSNRDYVVGTRLRHTMKEATPDILVLTIKPEPAVYGIEAKMFEPVASVPWQLHLQREHCLLPIAENMRADLGAVRTVSMALVPTPRARAMHAQGVHALTWDDVLQIGNRTGFYSELLAVAIRKYEDLASNEARTYEGGLTGAKIVEESDNPERAPRWVGAAPGPRGNLRTLATEEWRTTVFRVNWTAAVRPSRNWMSLTDFLDATGSAG